MWWMVLLFAALLALRKPWALHTPQLWAEDGIFFHQATALGAAAFGHELAGYFQLAPRLIAALALLPDPRWVPHVFVGSALALTLYTAARALSSRCPLPFGPACALAVVLAPDASEVLLNAGNLQWIFATAFVLLLISADGRNARQHTHDFASAVLFGLSGPFSILFTPLFVWRVWVRRTRPSAALAVVVVLCAIAQTISILQHPQAPPPGATLDVHALVGFAGIRVLGGLLFGAFLPAQIPWGLAAALSALTLAAVAFLAARPGLHRTERLWIGLAFLALLTGSIFRCWHSMPALCQPGAADRYVYPLEVTGAWLLLAWVHDGSRATRRVAFCAILVALAVNLPRLVFSPLPDKHWADYAPKLRAGEAVTIPINPGWDLPFPERQRR
jgi:hypothetical protein